jgi:4-amino-4-deoxy-L-arabinose transferase-like glycosyltransferase
VLWGSLSVFSTYCLLRLFCKSGPAFLATLLMALAYWHLHYSRFGHYNIEQVFYETMAFYFLFKAMQFRSLWRYVAAGFSFGLAILPHLSSRLLPFGGIAMLVYWLAARRDVLRRHATGLLAFVVAAWMLASPALTYWVRVIPISMGRAKSVSIFDRTNTNAPADVYAGLVMNIKNTLMMFNRSADSRPRDNPVAPDKILERYTAVCFLLAFLYCLYHWKQPLNFFLSALFLIILAASCFSVEAPQTLRTAGAIPLVFCFVAVALSDLRRPFAAWKPGWGGPLLAVALSPLFAFFGYQSWRT